jgi:hypothetical protein
MIWIGTRTIAMAEKTYSRSKGQVVCGQHRYLNASQYNNSVTGIRRKKNTS